MGVQLPEVGGFQEEPRTPPGLQGHNSDDDLYSDTGTTKTNRAFTFDRDIDFRNILPVLPIKGVFEDYLGDNYWDPSNDRYCGKCFEDVKRDLKKLAEVVDTFRNERDVARKETEVLRKEVEELKSFLRKKEENEKGDVTINIANGSENLDVIVRNKDYGKESDTFNSAKKSVKVGHFGILSFSISLPKDKSPDKPSPQISIPETKAKKTVAELRKEFFSKEFESQQKTLTAHNYLEIKPEEKKETFRSKLNIRVKPKKKISELISKLTSKIGTQKVIPDPTPICMFQRFEKIKTVWVSEVEEKSIF